MAQELWTDLKSEPFWLEGDTYYRDDCVFTQDAGRSGAIAQYTIVAKSDNGEYIPLETLSTGTGSEALPKGILAVEITEAAIKAGDVVAPVYIQGKIADADLIAWEPALATTKLDSVIVDMTQTVGDYLELQGILTGPSKWGILPEHD